MQFQGWAAETLINSKPFQWLSAYHQTEIIAGLALSQMPDLPKPKDAINTLVSEALHFRRGIRKSITTDLQGKQILRFVLENMRCLDSEWEIPISDSAKYPGKRNYEQIQQAWYVFLNKTCTAFHSYRLKVGCNQVIL